MARATKSTALVRVRRRVTCLDCHHRLVFLAWEQPALFLLHGFGYTERHVIGFCNRCGYWRHVSTSAIAPRRG